MLLYMPTQKQSTIKLCIYAMWYTVSKQLLSWISKLLCWCVIIFCHPSVYHGILHPNWGIPHKYCRQIGYHNSTLRYTRLRSVICWIFLQKLPLGLLENLFTMYWALKIISDYMMQSFLYEPSNNVWHCNYFQNAPNEHPIGLRL